jgi:hypothetical protein
MHRNLNAVKEQARDLRHQEPRDPEEKLGGFRLAARFLDKCRATLAGMAGDFAYGCPMDRSFLEAAGIGVEEFKAFVATGATDEEVDRFIREQARKVEA